MKFFEDLRENAKIELVWIEKDVGGQPVPANDNELTDEEKALDAIGAAVGGFITGQPLSLHADPYHHQQMMYRKVHLLLVTQVMMVGLRE